MARLTGQTVTGLGRRAKYLMADLGSGDVLLAAYLAAQVAGQRPYREWYDERVVNLDELPERAPRAPRVEPLRSKQLAFGYSQEDLRLVIAPMAANGEEPTASMGNDAALAVLSDRQPPLFAYFKQLFAQVTNPPIDPIREAIVMSVATGVGSERNLLDETPEHAHQLAMETPILRNAELEKLRGVDVGVFRARTLDVTWPVAEGPAGMEVALERVCREADTALAASAKGGSSGSSGSEPALPATS